MDQTFGEQTVGAAHRTIIAMFDDTAAATRAMSQLETAGTPRSDMSIHQAARGAASLARDDDDESWWDSIKRLFMPDDDAHTYREGIRRGGVVLVVHVDSARNDRVIDLLEQAGSVDIDERAQQWRSEGWTPGAQVEAATPAPERATPGPNAPRSTTPDAAAATETRIPIAREALRVGKRDVSVGHVRVRAYTVERPVHEAVALRHDTVEIERRPATDPTAANDAFRDRTLDVEETREEAVIGKEARVDEELVVRKRTEQEQRDVSDTVRETQVEVEDERAGRAAGRPAAPKRK